MNRSGPKGLSRHQGISETFYFFSDRSSLKSSFRRHQFNPRRKLIPVRSLHNEKRLVYLFSETSLLHLTDSPKRHPKGPFQASLLGVENNCWGLFCKVWQQSNIIVDSDVHFLRATRTSQLENDRHCLAFGVSQTSQGRRAE